jgi:hypothetical protein
MRPIRVTGGKGRIHAPSGRQGAVASDVPTLAFSSFLADCTGTTQAGESPAASSPATGPIPPCVDLDVPGPANPRSDLLPSAGVLTPSSGVIVVASSGGMAEIGVGGKEWVAPHQPERVSQNVYRR